MARPCTCRPNKRRATSNPSTSGATFTRWERSCTRCSTLQPPVDKEGGYLAILMRVMQGEIVPPEQRIRAGMVPRELSAIAMKALAKNPRDRYPTVEALRKDIERFQEGRSVSAKEDTKWETIVKFAKRNKAFSATATVAMLVLLVVLAFTFKNYHEKEARTRKAVPAFLRAGKLAVNERQFKDALDQVTVAVDFDPDNAEAHLFKGQLLIVSSSSRRPGWNWRST